MDLPVREASEATVLVLRTARELHQELRPGSSIAPRLDSTLERDLGFDSLARVELVLRLEQAFGVGLPEQALGTAETLADLVQAVRDAGVRGLTSAAARPVGPAMPEARAAGLPDQAQTVIEVLDWHVKAQPARVHVHLIDGAGGEERITYGDLHRGAGRVAAGLVQRGLAPGQSVALMLPTGRDYLESFFGILMAGGVPVPIYPPARLSQVEDHVRRHTGILSNAQAMFLITIAEARPLAWLLRAQVGTLREVLTVTDLAAGTAPVPHFMPRADDIAFLQYTSGSTGNPKGVVLSHANLLANIRAMGQATGVTDADVYVSWLPLYHDMGLIASWLTSVYYGFRFVLMSPLTFLARPERWLWAIHRYRATLSGAPNFAYELCVRKIREGSIQELDLSSWRIAYNGSEPVSPETVSSFAARFASHGFRPGAMTPAFGLAECAVALTAPPVGRGPLVDRVQRGAFMDSGAAIPAAPGDDGALRFVSCGRPLPGHEIRIMGDAGVELADRQEGRLEFRGPSATRGYFHNPEQTRRLFHDGWLDSGDLGYVAHGELYLTGRAKDVIIRGGRHIHPYELEDAVGSVPGVRRGCVAAFGSPDPRTGTDRLIVLAESHATDPAERDRLRQDIAHRCLDVLGMPADDVVVAPPHTVLKTSSGKIRRAASRQFYERRGTAVRRAPAWWQIARLFWAGLVPQLRRGRRLLGTWLFAAWAWTLFLAIGVPLWLAVVRLPQPSQRWRAAHAAVRALLALGRVPVSVSGLDQVPRGRPYVVVANHASYLDGLFLIALWPESLRFVAKRELAGQRLAGPFLRQLGAEFVERFDFRQGVADADRLVAVARAGPLMFFPEGTLTRTPGLAAFHLGAFAVAAQAGIAVVPVTLRGTRSILRGDSHFPQRGAVALVVGVPIMPAGAGWDETLRLRDAARAELLRHCGEPDLGQEPGR